MWMFIWVVLRMLLTTFQSTLTPLSYIFYQTPSFSLPSLYSIHQKGANSLILSFSFSQI